MVLGYHYYHSEHAGVYKRQMWVTLPWVCVINVCSNGGVKKFQLKISKIVSAIARPKDTGTWGLN